MARKTRLKDRCWIWIDTKTSVLTANGEIELLTDIAHHLKGKKHETTL